MTTPRVRREPAVFRRLFVRRTESVSRYMMRVVLGGDELGGFRLEEPAASVRLLLPTGGKLVIPTWKGNEFLNSDGSRAIIRTFTPRRFDETSLELDLDVVLHGNSLSTEWARTAQIGDEAAISGPGRGYSIDPTATAFLLVGDESAIPAICQLLEHLPAVPTAVHIFVRSNDAIVDLHRDVEVTWHVSSAGTVNTETLAQGIRGVELSEGTRIWAAGEAAEMQRLRKHLFNERGVPRAHTTIRGYWKLKKLDESG